jgi:hypothetical protein
VPNAKNLYRWLCCCRRRIIGCSPVRRCQASSAFGYSRVHSCCSTSSRSRRALWPSHPFVTQAHRVCQNLVGVVDVRTVIIVVIVVVAVIVVVVVIVIVVVVVVFIIGLAATGIFQYVLEVVER